MYVCKSLSIYGGRSSDALGWRAAPSAPERCSPAAALRSRCYRGWVAGQTACALPALLAWAPGLAQCEPAPPSAVPPARVPVRPPAARAAVLRISLAVSRRPPIMRACAFSGKMTHAAPIANVAETLKRMALAQHSLEGASQTGHYFRDGKRWNGGDTRRLTTPCMAAAIRIRSARC